MQSSSGRSTGWERRRGLAAAACTVFLLSLGGPGPADATSHYPAAGLGRGTPSIFPPPLPLPLMPLCLRGGGGAGSGSGERSRGRGKGDGTSSAPQSSAGVSGEEAADDSSAAARRKRDRKGAKIRRDVQQVGDGDKKEEQHKRPMVVGKEDALQSELVEWGIGSEESDDLMGTIVTPTLAQEGRRVAFKEPSPMTVDPSRRKFIV